MKLFQGAAYEPISNAVWESRLKKAEKEQDKQRTLVDCIREYNENMPAEEFFARVVARGMACEFMEAALWRYDTAMIYEKRRGYNDSFTNHWAERNHSTAVGNYRKRYEEHYHKGKLLPAAPGINMYALYLTAYSAAKERWAEFGNDPYGFDEAEMPLREFGLTILYLQREICKAFGVPVDEEAFEHTVEMHQYYRTRGNKKETKDMLSAMHISQKKGTTWEQEFYDMKNRWIV